jgi:hypothetical protein
VIENIRLPPERPLLQAPRSDETILDVVTFSWTSAIGADNYRLLVDDDPFFLTPEENVTISTSSFVCRLPHEGLYYWKVIAVNSAGENESEVRKFTFLYRPEILSLTCDNTLVDRRVETDWGVEATRIEVIIRDNGGKATLVPENVRFWVRDAGGSLRVDNAPAISFFDVDENTRRFLFVFDPPDNLPDSSLGPFDVKVVVFDSYGLSDNEDFAGMGYHLFTVNDLRVNFSLADNTPIYKIELLGNAFRVYDNASTTLDNVIIVDNNMGLIQATFSENSFSKSYGGIL